MKSKAYELLTTYADKPPPETPVAGETLEQIAEGIATRAVGRNPNCQTRRKLCEQAILSALRNEREACAKAMCNLCRRPNDYHPAELDADDGVFSHKRIGHESEWEEVCKASVIREGK